MTQQRDERDGRLGLGSFASYGFYGLAAKGRRILGAFGLRLTARGVFSYNLASPVTE